MAKAIDKDYLLTQFHNFDTVVLENKYLQDGEADLNVIEDVKVNGTSLTVTNKAVDVTVPILGVQVNGSDLTPDGNKKVNVQAVTDVTMNGSSTGVTITSGVADLTIPAATQYKITKQTDAETGYFATYTLQANTGAGGTDVDVTGDKINIPKDYVIRDASLNTVTAADKAAGGKFENDPNFLEGDKYIDLEVNTKDAQDPTVGATHLYINLKDLTDVYTAGNGLSLSNAGEFSAKLKTNAGLGVTANDGLYVDVKSNGGLIADSTGLYVDFETTNIDFANDYPPTP